MAYTRQQWAQAFLSAIGAPVTTLNTNWVIAWTQYETSCCGGCSYNLLNTTETNTPGALGRCGTNTAGVQNYDSFANGVGANAKVLQNGLYGNILAALRSSDSSALCNPGSAIQQQLQTWGTGNAAAIAAAACSGNVQSDQSFSGTATTVTGSANIGSQQPCQGGIAGIGNCPSGEQCVQLNKDGSVIPCLGFGCVCVSNAYASGHTPSGINNPSNPLGLPNWLINPDWNRVLKVVGGVLMIAAGLLIAFWPQAEQVAKAAVVA